MEKTDKEAKKIGENIALRIKDLRQKKHISLAALSEKTGFAKSYLSQIENFKREPPISTLTKIAYAFGVDVMLLISGESSKEIDQGFTVVRPDERKTVIRPGGGIEYTYQSLNYKKKNRWMDAYLLTSGFEFPPEPMVHEGQEVTFMLEGKQEFVYDGKHYIVEEGDCFYFDSNRPHYSRSIGDKPAKFLVVFCGKSKG